MYSEDVTQCFSSVLSLLLRLLLLFWTRCLVHPLCSHSSQPPCWGDRVHGGRVWPGSCPDQCCGPGAHVPPPGPGCQNFRVEGDFSRQRCLWPERVRDLPLSVGPGWHPALLGASGDCPLLPPTDLPAVLGGTGLGVGWILRCLCTRSVEMLPHTRTQDFEDPPPTFVVERQLGGSPGWESHFPLWTR